MNILVDTSVWSLALRRRPSDLNHAERLIVGELTEMIAEGRVRLIGIIRQEVLSGIRNPPQFEKLRTFLRAFPDVVIDISDYEAAAQASNQCKRRGITVSTVDALICAVALSRNWTIFTTDTDFQHHEDILSIKLHTRRK